MKKQKITKNIIISELINKHPETINILSEFGFHCIGCPISSQESLEQGAKAHGINITELLKALNNAIKEKKGGKE